MVGVEVTLINTVTHACEVFRTPYTTLKDAHVVEKLGFEHVILVEPIDTIGEQHVDDFDVGVKHVILGD
jgi:hypothetical protein